MPNHFSDIGFAVETEDDFIRLAERAAALGRYIRTAHGGYLRWATGAGAELWAQAGADRALVGLHPHFAGSSRMRVALTRRVTPPESTPLDGAFYAWGEPSQDGDSGLFPFVFDLPDYDLYDSLVLPATVDVQIAAFAHELAAYPDADAYLEAQTAEVKFAPESFIPAGLFPARDDVGGSQPPEAYALFSGRVLATAQRTNPVTGRPFHWAQVRTLGGAVDVVADPATVRGQIVPGGTVQGAFWLSGRLLHRYILNRLDRADAMRET